MEKSPKSTLGTDIPHMASPPNLHMGRPPPGYLAIYNNKQPDLMVIPTPDNRYVRPSIPTDSNHLKQSEPGSIGYTRSPYQHDFDFGRQRGLRDQIRKKEDRREKNRLAAKSCREEKQNYIRSLEERILTLEARNRDLIDKLSQMKDIIMELTQGKVNLSEGNDNFDMDQNTQ